MDNQIYDVIIVGAGPAGLWAAMELAGAGNVMLIEGVRRLHDTRNVSNGFMGGSAKSDVRLFIEPGFGGVIDDIQIIEYFLSHLHVHSNINLKISDKKFPSKYLDYFAYHNVLVDEPVSILISSEKLISIEQEIRTFIEDNLKFKANCQLLNIKKDKYFELETSSGTFLTKKCILALGRGGAHWVRNVATDINLVADDNCYDIGVRLEFPHSVIKKYTDRSPAFRIKWDDYRTTAISVKGTVEMENVFDIKTSNGRTIGGRQTWYSSLGLLKKFEEPDALNKVLNLVQISNILADGQLIKESVGKILNGKSILSPIKEFDSLREGIDKILSVFPEIAGGCYLYAPEARLNALQIKLSKNMETGIKGLYVAGDMTGLTNSFVQAACSGLIAARHITTKT